MRNAASFIVKKRAMILAIIVLVTLVFTYFSFKIEMYTAFSDLLPKDHPYIRVHNQFWKTFGGANVVLLSVEVDRKSTRLNSSHIQKSRMPSSA